MKIWDWFVSKFFARENLQDKTTMANLYVFKCLVYLVGAFCLVWILNMLNIFIVDKEIVNRGLIISLVMFAAELLFCYIFGLSRSWMQYVIMGFLISEVTVLGATVTYHALLISLLPALNSVMYTSKKMTLYTYVMLVISTTIIVYVGYYYGVCDANMALLTRSALSKYIGEDGTFLLNEVNNNPAYTLFMYYVFPRSVVIALFYPVSNSIISIINKAREQADEMEQMADIDLMTGVYNKSKYLKMVTEGFNEEDRIAVIFWDTNNLKVVNDTLGHEKGDIMITAICDCIKYISDGEDVSPIFRVGGDEFIMVIREGSENIVRGKLDEFDRKMREKSLEVGLGLSASVGYACGSGNMINSIIKQADSMMYKEKKIFHAEMNKEPKDN